MSACPVQSLVVAAWMDVQATRLLFHTHTHTVFTTPPNQLVPTPTHTHCGHNSHPHTQHLSPCPSTLDGKRMGKYKGSPADT